MTRSISVCFSGLLVFASLGACGGVSTPDLFSASHSGNAGGSPAQGDTAHPGTAGAGVESPAGGTAGSAGSGSGAAGSQEGMGLGGTAGDGHALGSSGSNPGGGSNVHSAGSSSAGSGPNGSAGVSNAGSGPNGSAGASNAGSGPNGSAGADSAGASNAGAGGDSVCSVLLAQANQQLDAARTCNLAMNALPCTTTVANPCHCEVAVGRMDSNETKTYLATLTQLQDHNCTQVCPLACPMAGRAQCRPAPMRGSISGSCFP